MSAPSTPPFPSLPLPTPAVPPPPRPPALLPLDTVAVEDAVLVLRQAADAAGWERARQERALAAALARWIGREGEKVATEGRRTVQGWAEIEDDLRRLVSTVRLAAAEAHQENRRRLGAFADAVAAYQREHGPVPGLDG